MSDIHPQPDLYSQLTALPQALSSLSTGNHITNHSIYNFPLIIRFFVDYRRQMRPMVGTLFPVLPLGDNCFHRMRDPQILPSKK